jgi:uncharacterized membrane protein YGL010W
MKTVDEWLSEYGESHQHATNKTLHWICVPTIVVSLIGLLWSLPVPQAMRALSPLVNWGTLVLALGVLYYLRLSVSLAIGMLVFVTLVTLAVLGLERLPWSLWAVCLALFVVAWIGQFIGHYYEGKRPSFFKDVQFLMIGPLWLLSFVYRKLRIPY